ncbi:MAG: hypothetical protein ACOC7T_01915 [Planctomycetota bacterium]
MSAKWLLGLVLASGALISICSGAEEPPASYVWWEAEDAEQHNFAGNSGFGRQTLDHPDRLSGGDWLHAVKSLGHHAEYTIAVPRGGTYDFWVRKFWYYGSFRWRFDRGEWRRLEDQVLKNSTNLRRLVRADWVRLGRVELEAGRHRFRFETTDDYRPDGPAAFDCFVLSLEPFEPRGKLKPDEEPDLDVPEDWFAFRPQRDPFSDEALLDLRRLNHEECGVKGHLRARGRHLVWEDEPDRPVKLWGTHGGPGGPSDTKEAMDRRARQLAKTGCNVMRLHGQFWWKNKWSPRTVEIPDAYLDKFNYMVYALKKNGVYLVLNTYYDHFFNAARLGLPGYTDPEKHAHSPHFLFIHPEGRRIWRSWVRRLLDAENPYTGMRNAEDPTIAIVQIANEDNYFFWTFEPYSRIPAPVIHVLEKRFAGWLERKYGSLEEARTAWGDFPEARGDAWENGRVGLHMAWFFTGEARSRRGGSPRFYDEARFLTEDLRRVLGEMQAYLKEEIGYRGFVNGTNWITADPRVLEPLDKYAAMACDVMDRHAVGWYAPAKLKQSWSLNTGDIYRNVSALRHPRKMPVTDIQYGQKPHLISEPKCAMPNRFRADWFPFMAAYGVLQGTDAITHFSGDANWDRRFGRWSLGTPVHIGQSPAASLIFRKQYVKPGPVVVRESLPLSDLYRLEGAAPFGALGMDEMTKANVPEKGSATVEEGPAVDPLAIFTGRAVRDVGPNPGPSVMADTAQYIDRERKVVRSATGELMWDYGTGFFTIDAPKAQGAVGFLRAAGPQELGIARIDCENEYASILLVALDDAPLATSERILLQTVTEDTNYGWKTRPVETPLEPDGPVVEAKEVLSTGGAPIIARNAEGKVALKRSDAASLKVTVLTFTGYEKEVLPGGADAIDLQPDVLWYLIEKE